MKIVLPILALVAVGGTGAAKSPFDGVWLGDLKTQKMPAQIDDYTVANGLYRCDSCSPKRVYPADGRPHVVPGDPEVISESVALPGPRTMVTRIVSPSMTRVTTMIVAPDGKTATYVAIDHKPGVHEPLRTEYLTERIGPSPVGGHAASGRWRGVRYVSVPERYRAQTLRLIGDRFSYDAPTGTRFTALLGGPPVTAKTREGATATISMQRIDARTLQENFLSGAKTVGMRIFTISVDGKALVTKTVNLAKGSTFTVTWYRKP